MGLAEIVDVARNFAVMVRVQGPDPKGLKMRKHAFHHYNSGKTTLSASGMLLPGSFSDAPIAKKLHSYNDIQSSPESMLIVTVASVIEPFLSLQYRENISQAKTELIPGVQIDIMSEGKKGAGCNAEGLGSKAPRWLPAKLLTLVDIPLSSVAVQSLVGGSSVSLEHGWEVGWSLASYRNGPKPFIDAIRTEVEHSSIQSLKQIPVGEWSDPNEMGKSTTRVALLGVSSKSFEDLPNFRRSTASKRGDLLVVVGSPFGILSPLHFFNSISMGSIANFYPPSSCNKSLLMADVRCLPGMEGGPVFGEHGKFIGILTRPLRQRTSSAEIQLVIPWEAIGTACSDFLQEEPQNAWEGNRFNIGNFNAVGKTCLSDSLDLDGSFNHIYELPNSGCAPQSPVEKAIASVCLITIDDGAWASGVLLNKQGLILTNAHLLEPWRFGKATANCERNETKSEEIIIPSNASVRPGHEKFDAHQRNQDLLPTILKTGDFSVSDEHGGYNFNFPNIGHISIHVRLDHLDPWIWCKAKVVYVSRGPLDVALLQLEFVPDQLCPIDVDFTCPFLGSKAYVIGHGLLGPRCDFLPSACLGVIAKVVEAKGPLSHQSNNQVNGLGHFPAMIETTAAVHPGGSGGAVVNLDGHMIGLVTSNARHGGGTIIPHLNFSIPCATLEPIFKFSKDMQDLSLLEYLNKPNEDLSSVWALMPPLSSKPGPSVPNLPPLLPGDSNKDVKGYRFAKFIAERHELLKKTTPFGKVENFSTKFIPSKL